ncbi:hypothetical protein OG217_14275 [Streptomyces sp. NBC_01023]|uniref:hypothetical protein n=1 Tax=Streptomyces sp. NBC_01023 TaxID=2903724 RepID=UPI003863FFE6|nr:hypothetical protein OG217_14275 [Streptomyces sp. NBC_01023]
MKRLLSGLLALVTDDVAEDSEAIRGNDITARTNRVVPHTPRISLSCPQRSLATVWAAPLHISAEDTHLFEEERRNRWIPGLF